jgi:hypothetical protein
LGDTTVRPNSNKALKSTPLTAKSTPLTATDIDILISSSKIKLGTAGSTIGAGGNNLNYSEFIIFLKNLSEKYFYGKIGGNRMKKTEKKDSRKSKIDYSGNGGKHEEKKAGYTYIHIHIYERIS